MVAFLRAACYGPNGAGARAGIWRFYVDSGRMAGRGSETGQLHWVSSGRVFGKIPGEFGDRKRGALASSRNGTWKVSVRSPSWQASQ